jgi:hypothetical protein
VPPAIVAVFIALLAVCLSSGCHSVDARTAEESAAIFCQEGTESRTWWVQSLAPGASPRSLELAGSPGNFQTAPAAGLAAATFGNPAGGSGELRIWKLGVEPPAAGRKLAGEWAWDFSLAADGPGITWVAGSPDRLLYVAQQPAWTPVVVPLPAGCTPHDPRWLDTRRLAVVLRRGHSHELAVVALPGGGVATVYRASAGAVLSEPLAVPGTDEVMVIESRESDASGRLLRLAIAPGVPRTLASGFFLPRTLRVSPDANHIAIVSGPDAGAIQRREVALHWIGPAWPGLPDGLPEVTAVEWSSDGRQLLVARQSGGRRWVEFYDVKRPNVPHRLGSSGVPSTAPQAWTLSQ